MSRFTKCIYFDPQTGKRCGNDAVPYHDGLCAACYDREMSIIKRITGRRKDQE